MSLIWWRLGESNTVEMVRVDTVKLVRNNMKEYAKVNCENSEYIKAIEKLLSLNAVIIEWKLC